MPNAEEEHEVALIQAFVNPSKRQRWLQLAGHPERRPKLRAQLAHLRDLDERFASRFGDGEQTLEAIRTTLLARGAPKACHLLSESAELDGRSLRLDEALQLVVGAGYGTLVSCVPGRLAYYEGEEPQERYLLVR